MTREVTSPVNQCHNWGARQMTSLRLRHSELTMASETVTQSTACTRLEHSSCGVRLNTFECTLVLGASNSDTAKFVLLSAFADDTFFRHLAVVARGSTNMQYDHFPVVSDPTLLGLPRNMRRKYRT